MKKNKCIITWFISTKNKKQINSNLHKTKKGVEFKFSTPFLANNLKNYAIKFIFY